MEQAIPEILAACRFFAQVTGPPLDKLLAMAQLRGFRKGQYLFRQGDDCPGVYIIGSGLVRVFKIAPSGKEHVLHLVGPGGTVAEVAAIGGFPVPAFAEALEESRCVLLPAGPFGRALQENHALCLQIMGSMAAWVKHLVGLVEDIALRDAAGRTARYLLGAPVDADGMVTLPSLKRHLASHLNLTSETLSRMLRRLEDQGLIHSDPKTGIRVVNRQGLTELADVD